jgi:hypothetical protein
MFAATRCTQASGASSADTVVHRSNARANASWAMSVASARSPVIRYAVRTTFA